MQQDNKQIAFLNFAKSKNWDASLCLYDGKFLAILNPVNDKGLIQGESDMTINEAIENCKSELLKRNKK